MQQQYHFNYRAPLIIVLNNYKSERNEIISPELYAPKAKEMSEIKSVAEHNLLDPNSEIKTETNSSKENILEKAEDQNTIEPAPKAIPIEEDPKTEQPVALSTFE